MNPRYKYFANLPYTANDSVQNQYHRSVVVVLRNAAVSSPGAFSSACAFDTNANNSFAIANCTAKHSIIAYACPPTMMLDAAASMSSVDCVRCRRLRHRARPCSITRLA